MHLDANCMHYTDTNCANVIMDRLRNALRKAIEDDSAVEKILEHIIDHKHILRDFQTRFELDDIQAFIKSLPAEICLTHNHIRRLFNFLYLFPGFTPSDSSQEEDDIHDSLSLLPCSYTLDMMLLTELETSHHQARKMCVNLHMALSHT